MKNLYPKGKGKIHPSPSCPAAPGDPMAVLHLLPAAILALTAALGAEDREVLAYLVTRSLQGPCSAAAEERPRCRRQGNHQPLFDCGCFDCYTGYWFRWDSSPDRELIHQAIEAFEEHLASSEQLRRAGGKGGRRRDRRAGDRSEKTRREPGEKASGKGKLGKKDERAPSGGGAGEEGPSEGRGSVRNEAGESAAGHAVGGMVAVAEEELGSGGVSTDVSGGGGMEMVAVPEHPGGERRKAWPDVMGLFSSRIWSLWSPAA